MARVNIDGDEWADSGATTDPGDAKTALGFVAEIPPFQWFNWWMNRVDQALGHVEVNGVPDWDTLTNYLANGLAMGSDGVLYQAVQAQAGNDPVSEPDLTNWKSLVVSGSYGASTGWVAFNGRPGLIMQYGENVVAGDTVVDATLPIAYPGSQIFAVATIDANIATNPGQWAFNFSATQVRLANATTTSHIIQWLSIGY